METEKHANTREKSEATMRKEMKGKEKERKEKKREEMKINEKK